MRYQIRGYTAATWASTNPVLAAREEGVETDTGRRKIGDGTTAWNSLSYDDVNKPVSTAQQTALDGKVPTVAHGTTVGVATATASSITLTVTTPWGIRANGTAYYEAAGATAGEEAVLDINPDTGAPRLTKIAS